ncbi:hypothetical protein QZH41_007378 [Actinostola sp. cb2023]|nr:hypothetical protein QZH41_007378 [Actinostola sp. cb2023]
MMLLGTQEVKESTRKHVRRRLEAEFGEGLHFVAVEEGKRKMLVIPDNLTVVQLARENVKLQEKQTLIDKAIDNEHHIIEAALCIREKLKTLEINSSWPPKPSELHDSAIDLPDCLLTFLRIVLTGPPSRKYIEVTSETVLYNAWKKNLLWILARLHAEVNQNISSWTGFNISCRDDVTVSQDNIGYLSTIDAPATNLSTVHEVLLQSVKIKDTLLLKSIVVVFDQALYSKAVEIIWKKEEQFKDIVPRMGVFHTICTLLAVIGKRFQDAGLRDLCVEARVIAEGSVNGVLDGHRYNRAVRFHKLMYEALMRVAWKGFISWLQKFHSDKINIVQDAIDDLEGLCQNVCHEEYEKAMQSPLYFCITELFSVYLDYLRCDNGNLSGFWMTYVDMVEIMLNLIRASREGNWTLHLSAVRAMIPWCFAYNNLNYARYLTAYLSQMSHLEQEHPDVHSHLASGGFSVQIGENNPFGRIPVDQTCEETVNKDTQTPGGTKGFSLKPGAVSRYYMVAEYRSIFLSNLREMLHLKSFYGHTDLQGTRITRDEEDVKSLVDLLENTWINPFDPDTQELVSISTGKVAPPEVQEHLLLAREKGNAAYQEFSQQRIESSPPVLDFYHKMTKLKLKTFSDLIKKKTFRKENGKEIILKADRVLFGQMIVIAQSRNLSMNEVLVHPLGPLPWSLATPDGSLRKTNKATLAKELQRKMFLQLILSLFHQQQ